MKYHLFVLIAALTLAVSASAPRAQADAVPADVQLESMLSDQFAAPATPPLTYLPPPAQSVPSTAQNITPVAPSYQEPAPPGVYPNIPASWAEYSAQAQAAVPCEATCCNDAPWTHWYFEADLVGFSRDNDSRNQVLSPSMRTSDLDFGTVAGPYLVLGTFFDPRNQLQLVYFIAPNMSVDGHDRGAGVDATYNSTFQSAEINYLHNWNHWSFLAGFRYLRLDDHFLLQDSFADVFDAHAANNLYGGQIGVTYHREWSWILVDWAAKFGIYGNSVAEHDTFTESGSLVVRDNPHPSTSSAAFEFDLFLSHRFSPHWMGRIGLVTLSVSDVALAPDMWQQKMVADRGVSIAGLTIGTLGQW